MSSQERFVACGLAHSWPSSSMQPKPPDWSHSFCTWARASSTVPIAPMPASLMKSIISLASPPSTAIWGKAAVFWK